MQSRGAGDKADDPSGSSTLTAPSVSADPSVVSRGWGAGLTLPTFGRDAQRGRPPHSPDTHRRGDDSRLLLRLWRPQAAFTASSTAQSGCREGPSCPPPRGAREPSPPRSPASRSLWHSSTHRGRPPGQGGPRTLFLGHRGAAESAPHPSPAPAVEQGRRSCYREPSPEKGEGGPTSPNPSNSKPRLPSEVIRQQLYLFHLSNYHIIKCMNYKRAKALN